MPNEIPKRFKSHNGSPDALTGGSDMVETSCSRDGKTEKELLHPKAPEAQCCDLHHRHAPFSGETMSVTSLESYRISEIRVFLVGGLGNAGQGRPAST